MQVGPWTPAIWLLATLSHASPIQVDLREVAKSTKALDERQSFDLTALTYSPFKTTSIDTPKAKCSATMWLANDFVNTRVCLSQSWECTFVDPNTTVFSVIGKSVSQTMTCEGGRGQSSMSCISAKICEHGIVPSYWGIDIYTK
ncbi:uncharacterized protein AB675_1531 [Cyphellophora attinorum]|uniref:Uncharacterized protein n=1 Tax=Cyphellophora attinorum TaxID=1664694 RepID=A0A0N0NJT0_9EURO|nr:uncharacterized protein AB675_1531 [Phialophora attinorum]KPI37248.1 hypothetical protein AB675_1531 [Phialophora attinorum]